MFLLLLAGGIFVLGYYFAVTKDATLSPEKLILNEKSVTVYDRNEEPILGAASASLKQTVDIKSLPKHLSQAFVNTEDKRFYTHNGFDVRRIVKAAWNNMRAHTFKEGASTISQQLIKNTHLSQEKTVKRKLREWKLTRILEKNYTKDDILEKYLNTIYFGHSCFGITSAAEFYFGKSPTELTLGESALLAGLVKSPNNYSPFKNPTKCKQRKSTVLNAMLQNGSISDLEKNTAENEALPQTPCVSKANTAYMNFVFDELSDLTEQYGFSVGGKVEIYTSFDKTLQAKTEQILSACNSNKSALILDSKTLGFKACVSDVGNIRRLPGSLIKPLLVYAPALEENVLSPATPILDEKVNYNGYSPENYNKNFHGYVSARECVEKSLNIPAVKTLETLGVKRGIQYLEKLGLKVDESDESLALALGGMKNGFTLQELLSAFSVFPNQGKLGTCGFINAVKINGEMVYERNNVKRNVFSEESAYLMTDILKSVAKNGTAKKLRSLAFDIAAKTGTVGTENGNTDAYALSYTTNDCVAIWLGNADNSFIEHTGGGAPCNYLLEINQHLESQYKNAQQKIEDFVKPKNIVCVALDKISYYDTHTLVLADKQAPLEYRIQELFKKSAIPLKQSDFFSNPTIFTPVLTFQNGKVEILLDKRSPSFYSYKIERYDYATQNTIYEGGYVERIIDDALERNKHYVYSVTPLYNGKAGKRIVLPVITTKKGVPEFEDNKILEKDWWDY